LLVGLTLSLVMGRRGHDAFGWLLLGTLFGPLAAVFAVEARGQERPGPKLVAVRRSIGPGPVDVLAGVDGSPESEAALLAAAGILGPRLGRLTLPTVIPYDSGFDRERTARAALERQAAAGRGWSSSTAAPPLSCWNGPPPTATTSWSSAPGGRGRRRPSWAARRWTWRNGPGCPCCSWGPAPGPTGRSPPPVRRGHSAESGGAGRAPSLSRPPSGLRAASTAVAGHTSVPPTSVRRTLRSRSRTAMSAGPPGRRTPRSARPRARAGAAVTAPTAASQATPRPTRLRTARSRVSTLPARVPSARRAAPSLACTTRSPRRNRPSPQPGAAIASVTTAIRGPQARQVASPVSGARWTKPAMTPTLTPARVRATPLIPGSRAVKRRWALNRWVTPPAPRL